MQMWEGEKECILVTKDWAKVNTLFRIYFEILLIEQNDSVANVAKLSGVDAL